jgi:predicted nucleic acid-binding protein
VKLDGKQLVLDTNILLYWLRGKAAGVRLKTDYDLGARRPRPIVPVVVKAEIKSLALKLEWGSAKQRALDELLRDLPIADISSEAVIDTYARLDYESNKLGRPMGKNDLWIAALAAVQDAILVTTDHDFDHLNPQFLAVERIDTSALGVAG